VKRREYITIADLFSASIRIRRRRPDIAGAWFVAIATVGL